MFFVLAKILGFFAVPSNILILLGLAGIVLMATLLGMALGGWMSGVIFDLTGSYSAAFLNGLAWNLLNGGIVLWLLLRPRRRLAPA